MIDKTPYHLAQTALADLKSSVYLILKEAKSEGLLNVEIGKALGIYQGHIRT